MNILLFIGAIAFAFFIFRKFVQHLYTIQLVLSDKDKAKNRFWCWLLKTCGWSLYTGVAIGLIGAVRKNSLFDPITLTTIGVLCIIGSIFYGLGVILKKRGSC